MSWVRCEPCKHKFLWTAQLKNENYLFLLQESIVLLTLQTNNKLWHFFLSIKPSQWNAATKESCRLHGISLSHGVVDLIQRCMVLMHLHWNLLSRPVANTSSLHAMRNTLPIGCPWDVRNPMAHAEQSPYFSSAWADKNSWSLLFFFLHVFCSKRCTASSPVP